jgi:hypothetical protein
MKCQFFESCSAQLCPHDPKSLKNCYWFPPEKICRKNGIPWANTQRKIAAITKSFSDGYFTYEMLIAIIRVKVGLKGIDQKGNEERQRKAWFLKHSARHSKGHSEHFSNMHPEVSKPSVSPFKSGQQSKQHRFTQAKKLLVSDVRLTEEK